MATAAAAKNSARSTKPAAKKAKVYTFVWEGLDKGRRPIKGEITGTDKEAATRAVKMQMGATVQKIRKLRRKAKAIKAKDVAIFTRQLATMMKAGVPLLQSFDIVAKGHDNANVSKLLYDIKADIESGRTMAQAFREHPRQFNDLYCNLVEAGETAGILEAVLDRLAIYQEKSMELRRKIKAAMFYPAMVIGAAVLITAIIMIFVIPAFKSVFASFGAELPAPTMIVMAISEFTVAYWWLIAGGCAGLVTVLMESYKRSEAMRNMLDRVTLRLPVFGEIIRKAIIARWTRTLSTMFAAGVPLVDSLTSVAGASGNYVYSSATLKIQREVSTGTSLTTAMNNVDIFPPMVIQMTAIGEESGSLDHMLSKSAEFFEAEVDSAVEALASLMEPLIMIVLGTLIGSIVISMYLPIFKLGAVV